MSVQTQIDRLTKAKSDLRTAITNKGVTVPESALMDTYSGYVDDIQTGGDIQGRKTLTVTANGSYSINPDEGYDGMEGATISVSVPFKTQEKTITATENGSYEAVPDSGYSGLTKVTVDVNVPTGGSETFIVPPYFSFDGDNTLTEIDVTNWDMSRWKGCIDNEDAQLWLGLFSNCKVLTTVRGALGACKPLDLNNAFGNAQSLTDLDVSAWDTSECVNMNSCFNYCYQLSGLTGVEKWNTSSVTLMAYMFQYCMKLTGTLDLSGWDTSNVTNMYQMFFYCRGLTSLDLSGWNTSNVTNMSRMFNGCSGLTTLDLSNFNTENVTNMSNMFSNCSGLTSLDLSNFDTSNVTGMSGMFYKCSGLTEVKVTNCSEATQQKILSQLQSSLSSYTWTLADGIITRS